MPYHQYSKKPILFTIGKYHIRSLGITNNTLQDPEVMKVIRYCGKCGNIVELAKDAYEKPIGSNAYYHNPRDRYCGGKLRTKAKLRGNKVKRRYLIVSQLDSRPKSEIENGI